MNTNPHAKRILCFGDSLTWGYKPATKHERLPADIRWTGILQKKLGNDYEVTEEGLNSRTLISNDPRLGKEGRNGKKYLIPCLDTHDPIDLVILMLGTNELKNLFNTTVKEIGETIEEDYVKVIINRKSQFRETTPKLLLLSPPLIDTTKASENYSNSFKKSRQLPNIYKDVANRNRISFLETSKFVTTGDDGVHLDRENHKILGEEIYKKVIEVLI
jgi:lysophospholipase L1-like esterase